MGNDTLIDKLKRYIRVWINYFKIAEMTRKLQATDEWMRRRMRMIYWKQWKGGKTKLKMLQTLGVRRQQMWKHVNTRKGYW
jgi:hypothetical protein